MQKILFGILLLAMLPAALKAQSRITPALQDTVLLSETISKEQLSYRTSDGSLLTGVVVDYHENGALKLRKSVIEGRADGLWMEWYDTGIPRFIGEWKEGKGHGVWMYFHENGEVSERAEVRDDVWQGIAEGWHANGQKSFEGFYMNYQKKGKWTWWKENGSVDSTKTKAY